MPPSFFSSTKDSSAALRAGFQVFGRNAVGLDIGIGMVKQAERKLHAQHAAH